MNNGEDEIVLYLILLFTYKKSIFYKRIIKNPNEKKLQNKRILRAFFTFYKNETHFITKTHTDALKTIAVKEKVLWTDTKGRREHCIGILTLVNTKKRIIPCGDEEKTN